MRELLNKCRLSNSSKDLKKEIIVTVLFLLLGILLGIFAKGIDNLSIDDEILWQRILGVIDLRNVLSRISIWALLGLCISIYSERPLRAGINVFFFFIGMLVGYYAVTIIFSGFFPKTYMVAWGVITLFTPVLAFFAWYAKGSGWLAVLLSTMALGFFVTETVSYGVGYFHVKYYPESVFLIIAITVLFNDFKKLMLSLIGALIIAPFINNLLSYIFGGL